MMLQKIRDNKIVKGLAVGMALNMLLQLTFPMFNTSSALTNGPELPENQSFEPVQTSDMVNLFTGDFTYNIPLFNLPGPNGGYPFNLAYHGGIGMDQEATWVGLGWNLTAGSINRNVRGIPDDFNGTDIIETKSDMKTMHTASVSYKPDLEIFGANNKYVNSSVNFGVRYNNYKGYGISMGAGLDLEGLGASDKYGLGLGLNLSSDDGVGVNASASFSKSFDNQVGPFSREYSVNKGIGVSFNSKSGLGLSLNKSVSKSIYYKPGDGTKVFDESSKTSLGSNLSFANNSYSHAQSNPMRNYNVSFTLKNGTSGGAFYNQSISGSYALQNMRSDVNGKYRDNEAYGAEYMNGYNQAYVKKDKRNTSKIMGDYSREKDGDIRKESPNLPMSYFTYDSYNVTGQGAIGGYRLFRNDIGNTHDPYTGSTNVGASVTLELGIGAGTHLGSDQNISLGGNWSGKWENQDWESMEFKNAPNAIRESHYYKFHGELTSNDAAILDEIGSTVPIRPNLIDRKHTSINNVIDDNDIDYSQGDRMPRNSLINHLRNSDIYDLDEYNISFYPNVTSNFYEAPSSDLDRDERNGSNVRHHTGYITTTKPDGMRYNYGLPVYNLHQTEKSFSITPDVNDGTYGYSQCQTSVRIDETNGDINYKQGNNAKSINFYNEVNTPPYANAYMLTSVLGADYVDVNNNGPSDEDLGYFVKFSYANYAGADTNSAYQWRAPFCGANLDMGYLTTHSDNKGAYTYGEKEVWYMARAETKTHVAIFHVSQRNDLYMVEDELQNNANHQNANNLNAKGFKSAMQLDSISVYLKSDIEGCSSCTTIVPLQRWHFRYNNELCKNIYNSTDPSNEGKSTLDSLWVEYRGSKRGSMSPYAFSYKQIDENGIDINTNFGYGENNYDRWGNYKPGSVDACDNREFPYVNQFDESVAQSFAEKQDFQDDMDMYSAAWCLGEISLPTGGTIQVDYESDDYAYVQHKKATQMFKIAEVNDNTTEDLLYDLGTPSFSAGKKTQRRVYFKLEDPIDKSIGSQNADNQVYNDYVKDLIEDANGNMSVYIKSYMDLRNGVHDYVKGYFDIDPFVSSAVDTNVTIGVDRSTTAYIDIDGVGGTEECYTHGFVTLSIINDKNNDAYDYHPIAMNAWQHLRTNAPDLLVMPGNYNLAQDNSSNLDKAQNALQLLAFLPYIATTFKDYRKRCRNQGFGRRMDLDKSVIRLCTPDGKKYGGGNRVKRIEYFDNWDVSSGGSENAHSYGQTYDYTTTENGKVISSGVAQYEPLIGGDEIALRYPKNYPEKIKFFTDNNLFFEYPINEGLFPGPSVGYSKVTVRSLNTSKVLGNEYGGGVPAGISTTGESVSEFYTARDFPTLYYETSISKKPLNYDIPIPFVGVVSQHELTASQGYSIITNGMHGAMKSVATFGYDNSNNLIQQPLTFVEYHYKHDKIQFQGEEVMRLNNTVDVLEDRIDPSTTSGENEAIVSERLMGVEFDMVTDQRRSSSWYIMAGVQLNLDIQPAPIPSAWPLFSSADTDLRTITTNKHIHYTGILEKTVASDGQSVVTTENKVFDKETGRPLLATVNNNFEELVYNFSYPAYMEYEGMGPAYKNINIEFEIDNDVTISATLITGNQYSVAGLAPALVSRMVPGDEYIVTITDGANEGDMHEAIYMGNNSSGDPIFDFIINNNHSTILFDDQLNPSRLKLVRSGRRNHITVDAGNVIALANPLEIRTDPASACTYSATIYESSIDNQTAFSTEIDSVLHATAVTFNDGWVKDFAETRSPIDRNDWLTDFDYNNINRNPYLYGEKGVWHPQFSYRYIDDRDQNWDPYAQEVDVDIMWDGMFHDMALFNYQSVLFDKCNQNWKRLNEITKYNPYSYETENKDITGIYSSALYGFSGSLSTAVAANARQTEIAFESFEEYEAEANAEIDVTTMTTGNFDVYDDYLPVGVSDVDEFEVFTIEEGINNNLKVDKPFDTPSGAFDVRLALKVEPSSLEGKADWVYIEASAQEVQVSGNTFWYFSSSDPLFHIINGSDRPYIGTASKKKNVVEPTGTNDFDIVDEKAHTGKHSMKISDVVSFHQNRLELIGGKEYVFSCWVARDNARVPTYETDDLDISINYLDASNSTVVGNAISGSIMKGKIIEGWQQVHIQFEMPSGADKIEVSIDPKADGGSESLYVDDIRMYPSTGNINTYVFDRENLRLSAALDQNNFATIYKYDEQGNLFLTIVETSEGRRTIQENRGHSIEN